MGQFADWLSGRPTTVILHDGRECPAELLGANCTHSGVDPAFDLALLSLPATHLKPVRWADDFNPPVGTLVAAVGTEEQPLAVGVVSVPRRDLGAPVRPTDALPLRIPAGRPQIYGRPRPISGCSLRAAFGQPRATVYHVYSYECGGPIVNLTGRAIGVTIATPGPHGGMVIPGDCVLDLLPDLQSGRLAGNWAPVRPPGK